MATPIVAISFWFLYRYSCRQVYEDIKPKKRMAALCAAILFLGFAFVLTQSTAAIVPIHKRVTALVSIQLSELKSNSSSFFKQKIA